MDYKEKYEMALETIQEILDSGSDSIKMSRLRLIRLQSVFPEIRESEDEKIKKELIKHLKEGVEGYMPAGDSSDYQRWLAWLEKQGEQKPTNTVEPKCEESKTKIFDAPTPFEDKLYAFVLACEILVDPSKREFILEHSQEILDAAKEQIGKEQKSAWSEEDASRASSLTDVVKSGGSIRPELRNEFVDWLKSLKDRVQPQPKQEWSEEDELVVEDIEEAVINYWHGQSQEDLLDWLKSLKQRIGG